MASEEDLKESPETTLPRISSLESDGVEENLNTIVDPTNSEHRALQTPHLPTGVRLIQNSSFPSASNTFPSGKNCIVGSCFKL